MNTVIRIVNRLPKEAMEKPIGRWFRDSCEKKLARKVELANEDHCGPCGQYRKINVDLEKKLPLKKIVDLE